MLSALTYQRVASLNVLLDMYLPPQTSSCHELIGLPYRLGGGEGYIDCIQMVYVALDHMKIPTPTFDPKWYEKPRINHLRNLLRWGDRVNGASYDGDVLLFSGQSPMFGVVWEGGALHINSTAEKVSWCPMSSLVNYWSVRYCPTREN